jgi:putative transposase
MSRDRRIDDGMVRKALADLFEYIEVFYKRNRRHSSLGFMSPTQFMQDWIAAQRTKDTAA